MVEIASSAAISPWECPPMPSEMMKRPKDSSRKIRSSFLVRTQPISVTPWEWIMRGLNPNLYRASILNPSRRFLFLRMRRSNHCYDGGWAIWIALLCISQDRRNSRRQIPDRQAPRRGWNGERLLGDASWNHNASSLKVIAPRWAAEPQFLARFQREAQACGSLRHPNIV